MSRGAAVIFVTKSKGHESKKSAGYASIEIGKFPSIIGMQWAPKGNVIEQTGFWNNPSTSGWSFKSASLLRSHASPHCNETVEVRKGHCAPSATSMGASSKKTPHNVYTYFIQNHRWVGLFKSLDVSMASSCRPHDDHSSLTIKIYMMHSCYSKITEIY